MEDLAETRIIDLPAPSGDSTAAVRDHGSRRMLAAGTTAEGNMVALVSSQSTEEAFIIDMGDGTVGRRGRGGRGGGGSFLDAVSISKTVQSIPGPLPKYLFVSKQEAACVSPEGSVTTKTAATAAALEQLGGHVEELQEALWGNDLSGSFWVSVESMLIYPTVQTKLAFLLWCSW